MDELNAFQPDFIVSFPGVFISLLEAQEKGKLNISPKRIALGGESLSDEMAQRIRAAFGAHELLNSYGASECLFICAKRNDGEPIFYPHFSHVEVLNQNNQPVKPGEIGRVVITNFCNFTQPFIRYELGDLATVRINEQGDEVFDLKVGRHYLPISFKNKSGEDVSVSHLLLEDIFTEINGISKIQICINKQEMVINTVATLHALTELNANIKKFLSLMSLEETLAIKVNVVENIAPEANGKIPLFKVNSAIIL